MASPVADTYTAASGATLYAGRFGQPSARLLYVGDSNMSESYGFLHPYTWALGIAGGVLKPVANIAIAGQKVADVLARIDNLYTDATPGAAGLSPLGFFVMQLGTNDTRGGAAITTTVQNEYDALITNLLGRAERGLIGAVPPIGTGGGESGAGVNSYNAFLSSYCAGNSRLHFIDHNVTVGNGSGGWASGYEPPDFIHLTNKDSYQMGLDGGAVLASHLATFNYASPLSTNAADVYPTVPQWVPNHVMAGTGGSNGLAGGGAVATGWSVGAAGANINGTCAKVAADVGDPNQTPWQRISPTQIQDNGTDGGIGWSCNLNGPAITTSFPDALEMMVEVRLNALATQRFRYLRVVVYGVNNEFIAPAMFLRMGGGPTTTTVVMRSALRRSGTRVAHASAQLIFTLCPSESFTGDMGSIDFRSAQVWN